MSVPVAAEKLFSIGGMPVTNSLLTGWITVAAFVVFGAIMRNRRAAVPRGIQNAFEAFIDFALGFMDQVTHDRARSKRFLPIVGTLFPLILASNWLGLLPGVGTVGVWALMHGERELVPLIRPATSDLNMTLALGITSIVLTHVFGIMTLGILKHGNKFIQLGTLWHGIRGFGRHPFGKAAIDMFAALVEFMVGLIELISEAAKMLSLSLRLFGNIFAGEVLLHVLSSLVAFIMPTPFMFLELIVGVVQALVFSMLTLVYLTLATEPPHGGDDAREEGGHGEAAVPGRPAGEHAKTAAHG